jgi:hypothetical protein
MLLVISYSILEFDGPSFIIQLKMKSRKGIYSSETINK